MAIPARCAVSPMGWARQSDPRHSRLPPGPLRRGRPRQQQVGDAERSSAQPASPRTSLIGRVTSWWRFVKQCGRRQRVVTLTARAGVARPPGPRGRSRRSRTFRGGVWRSSSGRWLTPRSCYMCREGRACVRIRLGPFWTLCAQPQTRHYCYCWITANTSSGPVPRSWINCCGVPGCAAAGTSRGRCVSRETSWPVPSWTCPTSSKVNPGTSLALSSVQLFVERARAVHPAFVLTAYNASSIGRICQRSADCHCNRAGAAWLRALGVERLSSGWPAA